MDIPWNIKPTDCFDNDIAIGDKVAFVVTNYRDGFQYMCKGTIVGFTNMFVKIKPDDKYSDNWEFKGWINKEWITKDFILRSKSRIILL